MCVWKGGHLRVSTAMELLSKNLNLSDLYDPVVADNQLVFISVPELS